MFTILVVVMVSWVWACVIAYQTEHFKCVYFFVCQLHLHKAVKYVDTHITSCAL